MTDQLKELLAVNNATKAFSNYVNGKESVNWYEYRVYEMEPGYLLLFRTVHYMKSGEVWDEPFYPKTIKEIIDWVMDKVRIFDGEPLPPLVAQVIMCCTNYYCDHSVPAERERVA